jgi:hypothetical protein
MNRPDFVRVSSHDEVSNLFSLVIVCLSPNVRKQQLTHTPVSRRVDHPLRDYLNLGANPMLSAFYKLQNQLRFRVRHNLVIFRGLQLNDRGRWFVGGFIYRGDEVLVCEKVAELNGI